MTKRAVAACIAGALLILGLVGCGASGRHTSSVTVTDASGVTYPSVLYPAGYPKVVKISNVPEPIRDGLDSSKALELAPNVWVPLTSSLDVAESTGTIFGFCSAVKSYETTYLVLYRTKHTAGTCAN